MNNQNLNAGFVLLVDDEQNVLNSYRIGLNTAGINRVITSVKSSEVMDLLEKNLVDLLVLDLMMPEISGKELLPLIGEKYPDIPVIVITAINEVDTAVECLKLGAKDFMVKPVEKNRFITSVKRLLEVRKLQKEHKILSEKFLSSAPENPEAFSEIITENDLMISQFCYMEAIASSMEPVLIIGETGVGKELFAKAIHKLSGREGKFVSVNVAGLDDSIFSDTLFGHLKGAFTDAHSQRAGLIEEAKSGTLCLDEIGDLSIASQIKLLRLLQEKEYFPLGSDKIKRSDCRIVCTTNRKLGEMINTNEFRNDLYYRLRTHHIQIPPLRERLDDLALLVKYFLDNAVKELNKEKCVFSNEALGYLAKYDFPGNIRELRALIYDAVSNHKSGKISSEWLLKKLEIEPIKLTNLQTGNIENTKNILETFAKDLSRYPKLFTIDEMKEVVINEALKRSKNNVTQAARVLGVHRHTILKKIK